MTAPTPEQMRELADKYEADVYMDTWGVVVALHATAVQLDAVRRIADLYESVGINDVPADVVGRHLRNILTADTAPQARRDE